MVGIPGQRAPDRLCQETFLRVARYSGIKVEMSRISQDGNHHFSQANSDLAAIRIRLNFPMATIRTECSVREELSFVVCRKAGDQVPAGAIQFSVPILPPWRPAAGHRERDTPSRRQD